MNFRALARMAEVADEYGEPGVDVNAPEVDTELSQPPACSYCGSPEFDAVEDNGRVQRATCAACGGTMVSHGGAWMPDLIGSPHNHPRPDADPASGGIGGAGAAPVVLQTNDLDQRTAAADWCRHRHAGHCWLPNREAGGPYALYPPQDRGICPWGTASQQQINCPMSEAGPMAGMTRAAAYGDPVGPLVSVKKAGFRGHVEAYDGYEHEMREMDHEVHGGFDEDLWDESAPEMHTHERAHMEEHGDPPDEYHERHEEAYGKALQQRHEESEPIGHHTPLMNFVRSHGDDHQFWHEHAKLENVDHRTTPIIATQPHLVQRHLDRYLHNRDDVVDHVHEFGHSQATDDYIGTHHPMMVRHEGNMYAIEGHHRTGSDMIAGRPTRAMVFDADRHGGFPAVKDRDDAYYAEHSGLHRYAKAHYCDFHFDDPKKQREHEMRHHDDGVCTLTEHKRHHEEQKRHRKESALDVELCFHFVATWADVRRKAARIRAEGGVAIVVASTDGVGGHVQGDTGVYETILNYAPGSFRVANWTCGCAWAAYAWNRSPAYRRFEGRMCSHALALQYEAQSRGMFGRTVEEDRVSPPWLRDKVRQRYDRDSGVHELVHASRQDPLDPDGIYPADHGLDLARPPLYAFAIVSTVFGQDPADTIVHMLRHGMEHGAAQELLHEAIADVRDGRVDWARVKVEHEQRSSDRVNSVSTVSAAASSGPRASGEGEPLDEPTHAGVVLKAADTGRVLMIQRSHKDPDDPAAGTWEFPGGGREPRDAHSLHSGIREFEEETGQPFPLGGHVQHVWRSPNGVYQGHVVVVPSEDALDFSHGRSTVNPDDPDGDDHEQSAWWHPDDARKNPALRQECKGSPWGAIKAASLQHSATFAATDSLTDPEIADYRPKPPQAPPDGAQENPGSTGFATAGDPPEFDQQLSTRTQVTPFSAVLHDEPEPALPVAEAETPGEDYRSQMQGEIPTAEESMVPETVRTAQTVPEIIAAFQATAAGKQLAASKGADTMDIASAARHYLETGQRSAPGLQHTALKDFTYGEQQALINEGSADGTRARNFADLQIEGTHYAAIEAALAQQDDTDPEDLFV